MQPEVTFMTSPNFNSKSCMQTVSVEFPVMPRWKSSAMKGFLANIINNSKQEISSDTVGVE